MCERSAESFPLGVFSTPEAAHSSGRRECYGRGYKYGYEVSEFLLDHYDEDEDSPFDEIICPHANPDGKHV